MNRKLTGLTRPYQAALRKYLKKGPLVSFRPAQELGRQAILRGLETLDLARIHEQALIALVSRGDSAATREMNIRRAGTFFAEAITPIEETHRTALEANVHLGQVNQKLRQRNEDLAASTRRLRVEISERRSAEESLKKTERHYAQLLGQSGQMQEQLRHLSRQLLAAQEDERKKISRELHDVIAQTLTGINVRLANLRKDTTINTEVLKRNIARTEQLVRQSVDIVHRFARELRPTVLDDLGLIPALHTFLKSFKEDTGIQVSLSIFAAVEEVKGDKRTVLYRVAQEALTNVARHARASRVEVSVQKVADDICMKIKDNGKGFQKALVLHAKKNKRLGLLGMRERIEMVNGNFTVESIPGKGTTVQAKIPFANGVWGGAEAAPIASARPKL
jgi:signal transduction histidine kinase